jgi:hypothetical protein
MTDWQQRRARTKRARNIEKLGAWAVISAALAVAINPALAIITAALAALIVVTLIRDAMSVDKEPEPW